MADTPTYYYLAIGRLGRGEVVNLFLKDAGVDIKDVRYPYDATWPARSEQLKKDGISRTGKVPALEYKGSTLTQHVPTLRYLARDIGGYDGETSIEKYEVDAVADIYIDWRAKWVANISGASDEFKNEFLPETYRILAQYYGDHDGPYLLGDRVTYADFCVYQAIDNNERIGAVAKLPTELAKFREAFEARPKIAAYIKEHKVESS